MAVKKVENFNVHETPATNQNEFDVETYLNANWEKTKEAVNNNAEELMQAQKDISTLKEDNKTNKSSIDVLEKSNETINKSLEDIDTKDKKQDEDIKANKESIEELQAENLEIKVENERLRNDIKSIAVVNEVSGENIHIEDSSDARCEIEIGGNHQQDTRSGKNRIDLSKVAVGTKNGVTATYNASNNSIMLNGTCTQDNTLFAVHPLNIPFFQNQTTMTVQMLNGTASGGYVGSRFSDGNYSHVFSLNISELDQNNKKLYRTEGSDGTFTRFDLRIDKDVVLDNFTIQVMLTDEVDTEYEMYGASPSILYPSEIKAVGSIKNILDMSNAKGGTSGGITCNMIADGSYTYKGTASSKVINIWLLGSYNNKTPIFRLEPGTYYIDGVVLFDGNNVLANPDITKIFTFINAHDITGVRALDAVLENTYDETKYPIIAKIDHEIPWVPYNYGSVQVNVQNKNIMSLYRLGEYWKYTDKGIKNTTISTGKDLTKFSLKAGQTIKIGFKLLSKPSQDTTFTCYVDKVGSIIPSFGKIATYNLNQVYERTYTATKDCEISVTLWGNANSDIFEFQMWAEYDNLTEYQKYDEQSYLVDVQQEMLEGDYLDLENEKEHHEWGKVVLDGTETWLEVSYGFVIGVNTVDSIFRNRDKTKFDGYSNYLKVEKTSQAWTKINYCGWNTDGAFWIREDYTIAKNIDDFKAYLKSKYDSGNPVVVYYPLATPVELDFTEAQKAVAKKIKSEAHTYKNITNISAESSEVNPIASVKYLKDAETEHNKLQAQIDEIKQLLSTTETSALLVNNLEKDLRMEV